MSHIGHPRCAELVTNNSWPPGNPVTVQCRKKSIKGEKKCRVHNKGDDPADGDA